MLTIIYNNNLAHMVGHVGYTKNDLYYNTFVLRKRTNDMSESCKTDEYIIEDNKESGDRTYR